MDYAGSSVFIGAGATLATDLWAIARGRLFGVPAPDWGLVGRWLGHMARGRFRHERIATAEPVRGERAIGWTAHYLIGITFAGGLLAICGLAWARQPTTIGSPLQRAPMSSRPMRSCSSTIPSINASGRGGQPGT